MTRRILLAVALLLIVLIVALHRPKYRGEPSLWVELGIRGPRGEHGPGFWVDPFGPILFHSYSSTSRLRTVPNPWWHWMHPGTAEQARRELRETVGVSRPRAPARRPGP